MQSTQFTELETIDDQIALLLKRRAVIDKSILETAVVEVCRHFKIEIDLLRSPRRDDQTVWPRHVAMALCRELTNVSLEEIGAVFNRTYGTVIHACKNVDDRVQTCKSSALTYRFLRSKIKNMLGDKNE